MIKTKTKELKKDKKTLQHVKKCAEVIVLVIAVLFIGRYIWTGWPQLIAHIHNARWWYVLPSTILFVIYFILRSVAWRSILVSLGGSLTPMKAGNIWFLSEFSRYVPGNVWSFLGRVYLCSKENIPKRITGLSLILEIFYLVGTSLCLGVIFFLVGPNDVIKLPYWILVFIIPAIIIIINPQFLEVILNKLLALLKRDKVEIKLGFGRSFSLFILYILAWLAYGTASYLTALIFVDLGNGWSMWLILGFILSWVIGYLSFVTPMGLGVREAMVITIMKSVISGPLASLVALVTRLALILSELIVLILILSSKKMGFLKNWSINIRKYCTENKHSVAIATMILLYIIYFLSLTFLRHSNYLTSRYDLGNMDQIVWNTAHGHFFQLTSPEIGNQISRFSIHGDIFLVLLAPFYWIYSSPYTLLFIQTVVIAFGALPLYWLGKAILNNKNLALAAAFAYLMYPGTQWANIFDFHSITLATSFLLFTFYFAYQKKYLPFFIFALLSLATKETVAFPLVMMAIYFIIAQKNWKLGAIVGALALGWFALLLWKIMPDARGNTSAHFALSYYKNFGQEPSGIIKNLLFHPADTIDYIGQNNRWHYLVLILAPTGYLAILSPYIVLAGPSILLNILSDQTQMRMIYYQYTSDIAPFLFISMIFGLNFLIRTMKKYINVKGSPISLLTLQKIALAYLLIATLYSSWLWSPLPLAKDADLKAFTYKEPAKEYLDKLSKTIPKDASVSATNRLSPHFTEREVSYLFPNGVGIAQYLIVEDGYEFELNSSQYVSENIKKLKNDQRYKQIYKIDSISVFKKQ